MMTRYTSILFAYPAALALVACGGSKPPEATAPTGSAMSMRGGTSSTMETPAQASTSGNIQIAQEILSACGISAADAFFPFDSSRLEKRDIKALNDVAVCFTTGPMKGHTLKLIGRADPRGAPAYNMTLGQSRADSVQKYLMDKGMTQGSAPSTTRGAMDATGTDETGWAHDRRVDIMLGN